MRADHIMRLSARPVRFSFVLADCDQGGSCAATMISAISSIGVSPMGIASSLRSAQ
jgi:hypothetical protein